MTALQVIAAAVAAFLLAYLAFALLYPEKLS